MLKKHLPFVIIVVLLFFAFFWNSIDKVIAQGETANWYFGWNAGLNFNGGAPVAISNGQINTLEGCASISDTSGNLLFYSDGITVWNKYHAQMNNGFGLAGGSGSSTQSALIIQKPGIANIYYIFTSDELAGPKGISYSTVDMTLAGGIGTVITKNNLLKTPSCEKITAVRHCNNEDVWVITHDWNSDAFSVFLVTSAGVNTIPVVSTAGIIVSGTLNSTIGYLKASPNGKKLASVTNNPANFELFDFNNSTGIVSNAILFPSLPFGNAYGVEFSPYGTKMYGTIGNPGKIYQFDLCSPDIKNSGILIGTSSDWSGSLQLGPDKKIYVSRINSPWLGIINYPDFQGTVCNYVDNGVWLSGQNGAAGLPNFASWYFIEPPPQPSPFLVSVNCLTGTFTSPQMNVLNCSISFYPITDIQWNFGDASSAENTSDSLNPVHNFTSPGTYSVSCIFNCGKDTLLQQVVITPPMVNATVTGTDTLCNTQSATLAAGGGVIYLWSTGENSPAITVSPPITTTYVVTVTDISGCSNTVSHTIGVLPFEGIDFSCIDSICPGKNATITASGGEIFAWSSGENTSEIIVSPFETTIYSVTVTSDNGCTDSAAKTITVAPDAVAGIYAKDTVCTGNSEKLSAGIGDFYQWNTGEITSEITVSLLISTTFSLTTTNSSGCSDSVTKTIIVKPSPIAEIYGNDTICSGNNSMLIASGGETFLWSTNETDQIITISPGTNTIYSVIVSNTNCSDTASVNIIVNDNPEINITVIPIENSSFHLSASGGEQYHWAPEEEISCVNCPGPVATPAQTTTYCVKVTDINGCSDSACKKIIVSPVFIPNAFTPDDNDLNEIFKPQVSEIHDYNFKIFNLWGDKLFETSNPDEGWNGIYQGKKCSAGVYIYKLIYTDNAENPERKFIGKITLLGKMDF